MRDDYPLEALQLRPLLELVAQRVLVFNDLPHHDPGQQWLRTGDAQHPEKEADYSGLFADIEDDVIQDQRDSLPAFEDERAFVCFGSVDRRELDRKSVV